MLPDINLTHLRYFYDAVQLKSVSRAARANFVSQSAISQGISKVEQALGIKLTTHQRQHFKLTEEGELVFEEASKIFASIENLQERLRGSKGEISGQVKFACTNALAQFFLPSYYLLMRDRYPLARLIFHRGSLQFMHDALRQEKVNFILALDSPEFYRYNKVTLRTGNFRLYTAKKAKNSAGILIDHEENSEVIQLRKAYQQRYGKELVIQEALSGWALVSTFVQMGYGIGYLPDFIFTGNNKVKEVTMDLPLTEYAIMAFWLKTTQLSRAAKAFIDILKK